MAIVHHTDFPLPNKTINTTVLRTPFVWTLNSHLTSYLILYLIIIWSYAAWNQIETRHVHVTSRDHVLTDAVRNGAVLPSSAWVQRVAPRPVALITSWIATLVASQRHRTIGEHLRPDVRVIVRHLGVPGLALAATCGTRDVACVVGAHHCLFAVCKGRYQYNIYM